VFPEDQKVVIDLSDWDDSSDDAGMDPRPLSRFFHLTRATVDEEMEIGEEAHGPPRTFRDSAPTALCSSDLFHAGIPGPYPTDLPPGQEVADAYYVVDHGREVGIFTDKYVVFTLN